ncbi:MAG: hypothetical protein HYT66_01270, partial [Candidatus Yanofskybacteria bacterium]|nr:hypothetical protein [Candidatus Yanofskybacteria bacterium]
EEMVPEEEEAEENTKANLSIPDAVIADNKIESGDDLGDAMYDEAKVVVAQAGKASASLLQRRLRVGYARAARLLDLLEEKGVIGPGEGAKPREVFIGRTTDDGAVAQEVPNEELDQHEI